MGEYVFWYVFVKSEKDKETVEEMLKNSYGGWLDETQYENLYEMRGIPNKLHKLTFIEYFKEEFVAYPTKDVVYIIGVPEYGGRLYVIVVECGSIIDVREITFMEIIRKFYE